MVVLLGLTSNRFISRALGTSYRLTIYLGMRAPPHRTTCCVKKKRRKNGGDAYPPFPDSSHFSAIQSQDNEPRQLTGAVFNALAGCLQDLCYSTSMYSGLGAKLYVRISAHNVHRKSS